MEFIEEGKTPILISNAEVMQLLSDRLQTRLEAQSAKKKKPMFKFQNRDWIEEEVHRYLEATSCVKLDMKRSDELKTKLRRPMRNGDPSGAKSGFGLTEAEALQILNSMPTQPVEIHLLIEKLPSRLSEEQQGELLKCISSYNKKADEQDQNQEVETYQNDTENMENDEQNTEGMVEEQGK